MLRSEGFTDARRDLLSRSSAGQGLLLFFRRRCAPGACTMPLPTSLILATWSPIAIVKLLSGATAARRLAGPVFR